MRFAELTLDLAEMGQGTEEHTVTSYSAGTRTMTIDTLSGKIGEYGGGTLWFFDDSGNCHMRHIVKAAGSQIVIHSDLPDDFTISEILISPEHVFDTQMLIAAVNSVLVNYPIMATDESLIYDRSKRYYVLPDKVTSNIRRVEFWTGDTNSGRWDICHYWESRGRVLEIYGGRGSGKAKIRISYVTNHGRVKPDGIVDPSVDREYIRYMGYLYLFRNQVQRRHKDNPVAADLYNEAKLYEQQLSTQQVPLKFLLRKDMCYPYV